MAVQSIVCDYEVALHGAIRAVFARRQIRILGCHFNFVQSLVRRLATLNLRGAYRDNRNLRDVVRLLKTVGFLPPANVLQQYQ